MRRCGKPASLHGLTVPCMLKRGHGFNHSPSRKECKQAGMWINHFHSHCEVHAANASACSSELLAVTTTFVQAKKILAELRR